MSEPQQSEVERSTVALAFRPPSGQDFPVLAEIRRDPFMQNMLMAIPEHTDDAAVRDWIQRRVEEPGGLFHVIADAATDAAIGFIQIHRVEPFHRTAYGALAISRQSGRRGVGAEALRGLMHAARYDLGLHSLLAEILVDNKVSLRLHEAAGYRRVGVMDEHFADHDFRYHAVVLMQRRLEP